MTNLDLFGTPVFTERPASHPCLLVLAEVAYLVDRGLDDGIGASEVGHRKRTVDACERSGWLTRHHVGNSDTEGGPRRLRLTNRGRHQVEKAPEYIRRLTRERYEGRSA